MSLTYTIAYAFPMLFFFPVAQVLLGTSSPSSPPAQRATLLAPAPSPSTSSTISLIPIWCFYTSTLFPTIYVTRYPLSYLTPLSRLASLSSLYQFISPHILNPPLLKGFYNYFGRSLTALTFQIFLPLDVCLLGQHSASAASLIQCRVPFGWLKILSYSSVFCHLACFIRLISVARTHDIPISADSSNIPSSAFEARTEYRLRLRWRTLR